MLFCVAISAPKSGYDKVLIGLAFTEFVGMVLMLFAIEKAYHGFDVRSLLPDTVRLVIASLVTLACGFALSYLPVHLGSSHRMQATTQLALAAIGCILALGPALWFTKSITKEEQKALARTLVPGSFRAA
jgi:hypothetical protein